MQVVPGLWYCMCTGMKSASPNRKEWIMEQKRLFSLALAAARKAGFARDDSLAVGDGWAYIGGPYGVIRLRSPGEGHVRLGEAWKFKPECIDGGEMKRGRFAFKMGAPEAHNFGMMFAREVAHPMVLGAEALNAVAPAMSDDVTRYYLRGAYLDREIGQLVATNGHLMLVCDADARIDGYPEDRKGIIIPDGFVNAVIFLAGRLKEEPEFTVRANESCSSEAIVARFEEIEVAFPPISGGFPDWRRVIPEPSGGMTLNVRRDDLLQVAKEAISMGYGRNVPCMVFSQTGTDKVNVMASYENVTYEADLPGTFEVTADIDYVSGFNHMDVRLGIDPRYVKVIAGLCDGEWLYAEARYDKAFAPHIGDPLRIGLRDNLLAVLMPMRP